MTDAAAVAEKLPDAGDTAAERRLIADLRDALRSGEGGSLVATVTLKDGTSVHLQNAADVAEAKSITLTMKDDGGESRTVGPFEPKDANAYYDLFLE